MDETRIRMCHGNHYILKPTDGYTYCCRRSLSYDCATHTHECYEFVYFKEGTCVYTVEGTDFLVSPGDLIFTCPNESHSFTFKQECMFHRQFLHIYPDYIKDFPEITKQLRLHSSLRKNHIPSYLVEQHGLNRYFSNLMRHHVEPEPETYVMAYSCSVGLMAKISHILSNTEAEDATLSTNAHINKILEYIAMHFTEAISLEDLAKEVNMSTVYISKLFKKETRMTLKMYINMYRIIHAKKLILSGEKISTLYEKCGFENYSTFYRAFIKYVGISPENFKNDPIPHPREL